MYGVKRKNSEAYINLLQLIVKFVCYGPYKQDSTSTKRRLVLG